jgi:hypothetical protein
MRIATWLAAAATCLALTMANGWAKDWTRTVSGACNGENASTSACFRACKQVESVGSLGELPEVFLNNCKYALANGESKPLKSQACGMSSCIVRLRPNGPSNARKGNYSYSGGGFTVYMTVKPSAVAGSSDTIISATIRSPNGGITKIVKDCAGDGSCDDWQYNSGPLKNSKISNTERDIILQFSR